METSVHRDDWLSQDDRHLLAACRVDTYRASGPGGQKRSKTSSAVRLRHKPTGLTAIAEESRSQHENKTRALKRLRMAIALEVRRPLPADWRPAAAFEARVTPAGRLEISPRNRHYPLVVAVALDALTESGGRLSDAARMLKLRTAQLSRFLVSDGKVLARVNEIRRAANLSPLS